MGQMWIMTSKSYGVVLCLMYVFPIRMTTYAITDSCLIKGISIKCYIKNYIGIKKGSLHFGFGLVKFYKLLLVFFRQIGSLGIVCFRIFKKTSPFFYKIRSFIRRLNFVLIFGYDNNFYLFVEKTSI